MQWKLPATMCFFAISSSQMGRRGRRTFAGRPASSVNVAVVIWCAMALVYFVSVAAEQPLNDKECNMQNVGSGWSKVEPAGLIYDEFKLGQPSDYARDRFDSSRGVSRLNNPEDGDYDSAQGGSERRDNVGTADDGKNAKRRKRRSQSASLVNDKRLRQLRQNRAGDRSSDSASFRMRKVLNVLIPNLARGDVDKQTVSSNNAPIWNSDGQSDNTVNTIVNEQQMQQDEGEYEPPTDARKRYMHQLRHRQRFSPFRHNWIEENPQTILKPVEHRHPHHQQQQNLNNDNTLGLSNACELCSSSSSGDSFGCCHVNDNGDEAAKNKQTGTPANKSKRQTVNQKQQANLKAMNNYPDRRQLLHDANPFAAQGAIHTAAAYPEIVAKTSSMLADNYRLGAELNPGNQPHLLRSGNPYADFLNYYDQQQVRRDNMPHLLSLASSTGENLYPGAPNINLTASAATALSSNPPDYNNNSTNLYTSVTTNATQTQPKANSTPSPAGEENESTPSPGDCAKYIDASNTSLVLQRVLDELERIRMFKEGQLAPEGQYRNTHIGPSSDKYDSQDTVCNFIANLHHLGLILPNSCFFLICLALRYASLCISSLISLLSASNHITIDLWPALGSPHPNFHLAANNPNPQPIQSHFQSSVAWFASQGLATLY